MIKTTEMKPVRPAREQAHFLSANAPLPDLQEKKEKTMTDIGKDASLMTPCEPPANPTPNPLPYMIMTVRSVFYKLALFVFRESRPFVCPVSFGAARIKLGLLSF